MLFKPIGALEAFKFNFNRIRMFQKLDSQFYLGQGAKREELEPAEKVPFFLDPLPPWAPCWKRKEPVRGIKSTFFFEKKD